MRTQKSIIKSTTLTAIFLAVFVMGSYAQTSTDYDQDKKDKLKKITQAVDSTIPSDGEQDVERDTPIEITLSEDMELDQETIDNATFVLKEKASDKDRDKGMQRNQEDMQHDEDMQQEQEEDMEYEDETEYETETDHRTDKDKKTASGDMKTINGTVEMENNTVRFIPNQTLRANTEYTLTYNTETSEMRDDARQQDQDWQQDQEQEQDWEQDQEQDQEQEWEQDQTQQDREMDQNQDQEWSVTFTTGGRDEPLQMVNLGSAENYVVLANAIHNETTSDISGEFGEVESDDDEGLGMNEDETTTEGAQTDTTDNNDGGMFSDDNQTQTATGDPDKALEDLRTAYNEVEQLSNPDFENVFEGEISGKTLTPGLYKWDNTVEIDSVVTLSGSAEDVWVFQVSEDLNLNEDVEIQLEDGAVPENVVWQVAGEVALRSGAHAEGVLLTMNEINLENGASVNGRMLAVNDISLDQNTITAPDMFRADRRTGRTGPDGK